MTPSPRGWCPSLFEPMLSGDGLLLRIKPRAARLDAAAARRLARASFLYGNGAVEITNRGNLQFRGFTAATAALFAREAVAAGVATADPAAERRRNILVSPLAGNDPECAGDTLEVARTLEAGLVMHQALDRLPAKFGFLVDGGGALGLGATRADVALRAVAGGWRIEAGTAGLFCTAAKAALLALHLARTAQDAQPAMRPARRPEAGPNLFEAAGLPWEPVATGAATVPVPVGPLPGRAFGIGLPPGRLDAALLASLATLAEECGDGTLRVTPWRALLLAGMRERGERMLRAALPAELLDPGAPQLRTACCIGGPGCANGSVPAAADAARLGALVPPGQVLHVSGCAKGCGHPGPAALTLVGRDGTYDLVRNGRASDPPTLRGLTVDAAADLLHPAARIPAGDYRA